MKKTIEEILAELPLDESVKAGLKESWTAALDDAKVAQEATVREELSNRYQTDLDKIHEAFGAFLEERIKGHVEELQEGVAQVNNMKVELAARTSKIKETAKAHVQKRLAAIEQVVEARIKGELSELHDDVVANRKAALQAISESKAKSAEDSEKFRAKAAMVLEHIINVKIPAQLEPLREDIEAARQDNFGREIFESFYTVFRRNFFNTSDEFKTLVEENRALKQSEADSRRKAAKAVKESQQKAATATQALRQVNESVAHTRKMNSLLSNLKGTTRTQMKTLLENTKVDKLDATFRKALPTLVKRKPAKAKVNEGKIIKRNVELRTGGADELAESDYDEFSSEVDNIRRLAGN